MLKIILIILGAGVAQAFLLAMVILVVTAITTAVDDPTVPAVLMALVGITSLTVLVMAVHKVMTTASEEIANEDACTDGRRSCICSCPPNRRESTGSRRSRLGENADHPNGPASDHTCL